MITAILLLAITIFIDQIVQLVKFIVAVKQLIADMEKEKEVSVYKIFVNADGKLFYEDKYSIAKIDGVVVAKYIEKAKVKVEVKFGSKHITQK